MIAKNLTLCKALLFGCFVFINSCKPLQLNLTAKNSVFLVFQNSNLEKKYIDKNPNTISLGKYVYSINSNLKLSISRGVITLISKKYKDFDEMERDNPTITFQIDKAFLKKNKDVIITSIDIQSIGYDNILKLLKNSHHIFLIDQTEVSKRKITVKEVFLLYEGEE